VEMPVVSPVSLSRSGVAIASNVPGTAVDGVKGTTLKSSPTEADGVEFELDEPLLLPRPRSLDFPRSLGLLPRPGVRSVVGRSSSIGILLTGW